MSTAPPNTLDVRPLSPSRKPPTVLASFDRLEAGESFVLVDDRDPITLRTRIEAKRPGEGRWVYLQDGPHVWHVRIIRRESDA